MPRSLRLLLGLRLSRSQSLLKLCNPCLSLSLERESVSILRLCSQDTVRLAQPVTSKLQPTLVLSTLTVSILLIREGALRNNHHTEQRLTVRLVTSGNTQPETERVCSLLKSLRVSKLTLATPTKLLALTLDFSRD